MPAAPCCGREPAPRAGAFAFGTRRRYIRPMIRILRLVALSLLVLLAAAWGGAWMARAPGEDWSHSFARLVTGAPAPGMGTTTGVALPHGISLGGPFSMTDQTGRAVTEADFRGQPVLMFFGFTHCPDVCPTELATMTTALDLLGPEGERVRPVFVSVDPERDTPARLAEYVALFSPRLTGLTGTPEQVAAMARAFRVYYARATPAGSSEYLMDHSAFIYLLGPDGTVRTLLRPGATPEVIAAAVRQLG